ncbi:uncharacterized protein LOC127253586 [Andrographis paniculata]|uniref:uncharacterized protein LOC127253586 n=1 Tax=Andrographis paniculata TaxID=175694 RepID=UPI0021E93B79|nr:uncharacterized protein LOC127253586 [Andrographis paniculata]
MALTLHLSIPLLPSSHRCNSGNPKSKFSPNIVSPKANKSTTRSREAVIRTLSALPETAASVAVAATIVGAAATFLVGKNKNSDESEAPRKICVDCGGSGVCPECNGEGFVVKRMSEENAEKARLMAKNMATRYTAGLPKKWSYCSKCSSGRLCSKCGGSGNG